jgi:hypothetical protein
MDNPLQCQECYNWASTDARLRMLGNGHHENCSQFLPNVGALKLIEELRNGIKWWGNQEDGIPDQLWEPYRQATLLVKGYVPTEEKP